MKLVIFINDLAAGGAERTVATLANYWAGQEWDITLVTLKPQSFDFYPLEPTLRRVSLNLWGDSANVLDALLQNVRRVIALRRIIKALKPTVVLSMMSSHNVLLALASSGISDLCAIGSERSYPPKFPLGTLWHAMRSRLYGRLAAVVALTRECAEWIKAHSSAKYVPVIPNAVCWPLPDNLPRIVPSTLCLPERKVLLAVGRLSQEKNFEVLVEVFSVLALKHPDWDLVILGEGPERQKLEGRIRNTTSNKRIFIPGIAGNVGEWYERADLYALCSHFEGFPNTLAEAMAYGVPAVSFDCDTGPRDILRHDIDGLLVAPGDVAGLESALDKVMGDDRLRRHFASNAIQARERFSMEKIAGMWEELFHDCMTGRVGKVKSTSRSERFLSVNNQ
jgi:glycosyltransferase involved in cell wall biosynthesis